MINHAFIGREPELNRLQTLLTKKTASLVVVTGRRRVGKSRLIEQFAKGYLFYSFSALAPAEGMTAQLQRDEFAKGLSTQLGAPPLRADDWSDLFSYLAKQTQKGRVIILFDEISWMAMNDVTFLGKLKNAWDNEFKKNPELILVLCGSVSTWIEKNIISSTGFYGRISLYPTIEELPLSDCNKMLDNMGVKMSAYEKLKILSVTGGIPWYLEHIQPKLNADENIKNLCFKKDGLLFKEFELIFHDIFLKRSEIYKPIVEKLAEKPLEFAEIAEALKYSNSGALSEYLEDLIKTGFITRDFTWLPKTGNMSRLSHFRLSDNYLRFYLKYVLTNKNKILNDAFENFSMSSLPGWNSMMGLQFENLVLKNRKKIHALLKINPEDIVVSNPFFQRKTTRMPGCQIDYLIQDRFGTMYVCEIKFSKNVIKSDIIDEMKNKISKFKLPRNMACRIVLIHVNGISDDVLESQYFSDVINFTDLLN